MLLFDLNIALYILQDKSVVSTKVYAIENQPIFIYLSLYKKSGLCKVKFYSEEKAEVYYGTELIKTISIKEINTVEKIYKEHIN